MNGPLHYGMYDMSSCLLRYDSQLVPQGAMSVRFNGDGSLLLALRRRQPPALYRLDASHPVAQFDHWGYYNSCTMKSCCFAGERDEVGAGVCRCSLVRVAEEK